jgi:hypothetical protein
MSTQRKNTATKKSPLTVRELQTWLDGYCSAHESDWSPTSEQWKLIKGKIFALSDQVAPVVVNNVAAAPMRYAPNPAEKTAEARTVHTNVETPYGEMPGYGAGSLGKNTVGLSDRPAMINKNGTLVMPSTDEVGGPSSFA